MNSAARFPWPRLAVLLPGGLALVIGVLSGLGRLGYELPGLQYAVSHGPLMVCGFLGTLIGLERAVALRARWAYLAPVLSGIATAALLLQAPLGLIFGAYVAAGLLFSIAAINIALLHRELHNTTMAIAAVLWPIGSLMVATGEAVSSAVWWWMSFLVLTIAGERIELSRFAKPHKLARPLFVLALAAVLLGTAAASFALSWGQQAMGLGLGLLGVWLFLFDIARKTIRQKGLPRFIAWCLFTGYAWLLFGALLNLVMTIPPGGPLWDAFIHSVFVGFVFAMIFGHAPVILPAVLKTMIRFSPLFYGHLVLMQVGLLLRIYGDLFDDFALRRTGALLNSLAVALFFAMTIGGVVIAKRSAQQQ